MAPIGWRNNWIPTALPRPRSTATRVRRARTRALAEFKSGKIRVLAATDIAARGLDIDQLPHVVNYELPNVPEDYIHRIGRTGRAGREGEAMSLVCVDESGLLKDIERVLHRSIPKVVVEGFEPDPSIKAEPINKGRGRLGQPARKTAGRKPAGNQPPTSRRRSQGQGHGNSNGNGGQGNGQGRSAQPAQPRSRQSNRRNAR